MMEESIMNAFTSMFFVVLVLIAILFLVKRYAKRRQTVSGNNTNIQVLAKTQISPKNQLAVVKVENRTLLIGMGESGVSLISDLSAPAARQTSQLQSAGQADLSNYRLPASVENVAQYRKRQRDNTFLEESAPHKSKITKMTNAEIQKSLSFSSFIKSAFKRA